MAKEISNPIRIYLYVAISTSSENGKIFRSTLGKIKNYFLRHLSFFLFNFNLWIFKFNYFEDYSDSNRGDIAIRLATRELLESAFSPEPIEIIEIKWKELDNDWVNIINTEGSLFVIGGGGYYFFDPTSKLAPRLVNDIIMYEKLLCPVVAFSPGVNHFLTQGKESHLSFISEETLTIFNRFSRRLDLSTVRDPFSLNKLREIGCEKVELIPDPALFLSSCIDQYSSFVNNKESNTLRIGVNLAAHGPSSTALLRNLIGPVAKVLSGLARTRPCKLFYMQHSDSEKFIPELLRREGVLVEVVYGSPYELIKVYETLDVHICEMLHSAILCTSVGTPVLHLAYDIKGISFFDLMQLSEYCIIANTVRAAELAVVLNRLIDNRSDVKDRILKRKGELHHYMNMFLKEIVALVQHYQINNDIVYESK